MEAYRNPGEVRREFSLLGAGLRVVFRPPPLAAEIEMCLAYPPAAESAETSFLEARFEEVSDVAGPCRITGEETVSVKNRKLILDTAHALPFIYRNGTTSKALELPGLGCGVFNFVSGTYRAFLDGRANPLPGQAFHRGYLFGNLFMCSLFSAASIHSVHAACAEVDGSGIIFTGDSGSGKSSAAFALMERGVPVLSDERVLLGLRSGTYRAASLCDVVKASRQAVERFFPIFREKPVYWKSGEDRYYRMRDCGFAHCAETAVSALCILNQTGQRESSRERIPAAMAVQHLFPVTINCDIPGLAKEKFLFLAGFLKSVPCFRINFGTDMDDFTRVVREIAREAGTRPGGDQ